MEELLKDDEDEMSKASSPVAAQDSRLPRKALDLFEDDEQGNEGGNVHDSKQDEKGGDDADVERMLAEGPRKATRKPRKKKVASKSVSPAPQETSGNENDKQEQVQAIPKRKPQKKAKRAASGSPVGSGTNKKKAKKTTKVDVPGQGAYVKLQCFDLDTNEGFVRYITDLPCMIGRSGDNKIPGGQFLELPDKKTVSRRHAEINFNLRRGQFMLKAISKNGVLVNKKYYAEGESTSLQSKDALKMGQVGMYFLVASEGADAIKPKATYAELLVQAFQLVGSGIPLSTVDLAKILQSMYKYYAKMTEKALAQSIYQALHRGTDFVKAGRIEKRTAYLLSSDTSDLAKEAKEKGDAFNQEHNIEEINSAIEEALKRKNR